MGRMTGRRRWLAGAAALALSALLVGGCAAVRPRAGEQAARYPQKPVTMIIAFSAGGPSDVQARIVEKYWKEKFGQPLVFVYKTGAGGAIGFNEIAKAPKDGYTIGGINIPHIILQPLGQQAQFTIDDFEYLAQVVNDPQVLAVRADAPYRTLAEFLDAARARPGKLTVGIVGTYTGTHIALLDLVDRTGIRVTMVPFKGAADQNAALLGGQVDAMMGNLGDVLRDQEKYRVLAQASERRHRLLPDVPTFREQGVDLVSSIRRGYAAPKGTDPAAVARLREFFDELARDPRYAADMERIGQPAEYLSGEELDRGVHAEEAHDRALLEKFGLLKQ